eukprot:15327628-Ditylum_brightwellii.AAC.1
MVNKVQMNHIATQKELISPAEKADSLGLVVNLKYDVEPRYTKIILLVDLIWGETIRCQPDDRKKYAWKSE